MIEPAVFLGSLTVVLAFLSWRTAAITPIAEKENILHQRWGDANNEGGKGLRGDHHISKVYSLVVRESDGFLYAIRKHVSGDSEGSTEINLVLECESNPSISDYEKHPWYDEVSFRVVKTGDRPAELPGTASLTLWVYSAEPSEIQYQLQYFGQITDHIISGRLGEDDSLPDFGEFEFEGVERTDLVE